MNSWLHGVAWLGFHNVNVLFVSGGDRGIFFFLGGGLGGGGLVITFGLDAFGCVVVVNVSSLYIGCVTMVDLYMLIVGR